MSFLLLVHIGLNPLDVSRYFGARFSDAIGMSVSIPENPVNKLARELNEKEAALDEREAQIVQKEKELNKAVVREVNNDFRIYFYSLAGGIILLFGLVLLNFYLDFRRRQKARVKNIQNAKY